MANSEIRIFYSWQSDLPSGETRGLIQEGISSAVKMLKDTVEIEADRDTKGEYGSPDIVQTIFSKIDECDVFIADVSIVNKYHTVDEEGKPSAPVKLGPNPNIMLELGYAASVVGWDSVICIINADYGNPDELPFDLAHRRLTPYSLKDKSKMEVKKYIRDIIVDTVSNLLKNGPRVKNKFSNIALGSFLPGKTELSKELLPFIPSKFFITEMKEQMVGKSIELIHAINSIHLETCVDASEDCNSLQTKASSPYASLENVQLMSSKPQRVVITEEEKKTISDFVDNHPDIVLSDDFFELGNLKKRVSFHIASGGTTYDGSESEEEKHDKIIELCVLLNQIAARELFAETFDDYILFPLAIKNISTTSDTDISVSVILDKTSTHAIPPTKRIINPVLAGIEGSIYEDGMIKEILLMPETSEIKYETDISYSITESIDVFKQYGVNGAHYDADDYEHELSKYIACPNESKGYEYEYYIKSLRPKEICWLGPMIMIKADTKEVKMQYSIKSNKSDGNLSGTLHYELQ